MQTMHEYSGCHCSLYPAQQCDRPLAQVPGQAPVRTAAPPPPPPSTAASRGTRLGRHAFSIVEMLVALTISATLLAATLSAFDASWRSYKHTTESASTHVVSRIVMHRLLAMIRTGTEFGPYPADFFDPLLNPVDSQFIEFQEPQLAALNQITRVESRLVGASYELWYVRLDNSVAPAAVVEEYPLLRDLAYARFLMEYEPGPRLLRATVDLTIVPNDYDDLEVAIGPDTPVIRLVASAEPRQLQIDGE